MTTISDESVSVAPDITDGSLNDAFIDSNISSGNTSLILSEIGERIDSDIDEASLDSESDYETGDLMAMFKDAYN